MGHLTRRQLVRQALVTATLEAATQAVAPADTRSNSGPHELFLPLLARPEPEPASPPAQLLEWAAGEDYETLSLTRDEDGVVVSATVRWPDGSTGAFQRTAKNPLWLAIDAYTLTHDASGTLVIQPAITRDSNGNVIAKPALVLNG